MAHIFNLSPEGAELCAFQVVEGTHTHTQDSRFCFPHLAIFGSYLLLGNIIYNVLHNL